MKVDEDINFVFNVEWYDSNFEVTRKFLLTFFPRDKSVEMFDIKMRRIFLRRITCDSVQKSDFYIGNIVVIFSRRLLITGYGNEETKNVLESATEITVAIIKPDGVPHFGLILNDVYKSGFSVGRAKMVSLNRQHAENFYSDLREEENFPELVRHLSSGPIVVMELIGVKAVEKWNSLIGPLRGQYGLDDIRNAAAGPASKEEAQRELEYFFPPSDRCPPLSLESEGESTCCIIKPHALKSGIAGQIIADIQSHPDFKISAMETFHLQQSQAEEFYEIYKGVVPEYSGLVKELSSGRCMVLQITGTKGIVHRFREIVGPADPELARTLRPHSMRAKFGISKERNAVHCTDLEEDGPLEIEYFFKILQ